jgi:hypothetical protein
MVATEDFDRLTPAAQNGESVRHARLSTVNRVARIHLPGEAGLARVHSLSDCGVELSSVMNLRVGQAIQVDFSETTSANATVVAKTRDRYSLRFEDLVNCAELLRRLVAEARAERSRPMRLAAGGLCAKGKSTNGIHELELHDISQRGMKVRHDGSFQPGLRVTIQLPNGRECQGIVRWTKNSSAGLQLADILSPHELGAVSLLGDDLSSPSSRHSSRKP